MNAEFFRYYRYVQKTAQHRGYLLARDRNKKSVPLGGDFTLYCRRTGAAQFSSHLEAIAWWLEGEIANA